MRQIEIFFNESPTKARTRRKIILATKELFAEYGIEGIAMSQISETAGITTRNLYRYYANKDLLVVDVAYFVFTSYEDFEDIPLDQNKSGFELLKELLYIMYIEKGPIIFDASTIKLMLYLDLYMLKMDKNSEAYVKYQTEYNFSPHERITQYLHEVFIKGLKDGTIDIPIRQLDFYIDFIIQSLLSLIIQITIKEPEKGNARNSFIEKQIEIILDYVRNKE